MWRLGLRLQQRPGTGYEGKSSGPTPKLGGRGPVIWAVVPRCRNRDCDESQSARATGGRETEPRLTFLWSPEGSQEPSERGKVTCCRIPLYESQQQGKLACAIETTERLTSGEGRLSREGRLGASRAAKTSHAPAPQVRTDVHLTKPCPYVDLCTQTT